MGDEVEVSGNTFALLGRLETMTHDEARREIRHLGGRALEGAAPTGTTSSFGARYVVVGQRPGVMLARARAAGWTCLDEQALRDALARGRAAQARAEVVLPAAEVIGELRACFDGPPTLRTWERLCAQLSAAEPERLDALVDYVAGHLARWPEPLDDGVAPDQARWRSHTWTSRKLPLDWLRALSRGEVAPQHRLAAWLDISQVYSAWTSGVLCKLLTPGALSGLRGLDLGVQRAPLPARFLSGVWRDGSLPALRALVLRPMTLEDALRLTAPAPGLPALRQIELASPNQHATSMPADGWNTMGEALFEAPWWSQIEGLVCSITHHRYGVSGAQSVYPSLADNARRLSALRGLTLCDGAQIEALCASSIFSQITHLKLCTLYSRTLDWPHRVIEALAQTPHRVKALDLSRMYLENVYESANPSRHPLQRAAHIALIEELIARDGHLRLRTLTIAAEALDPETVHGLDPARVQRIYDALDDAGVTLVPVARVPE